MAKKLLKGKPRVIVFDPMGEYRGRSVSETPVELIRSIKGRETFFAVYRPRDARAEFPWVARIAYTVGRLCLVAEEISWAISPAKMDTAIEILIRYGRHRDVELIGISRRPAEVNRDLTANASDVYIFRTHEPRDIAYFRGILGTAAAESLPSLRQFTPYVWTDTVPEKRENPTGKVE